MRNSVGALALATGLLAVGAHAQMVVNFAAAAGVSRSGFDSSHLAGGVGAGIATTPRNRRVQLDWNFINVEATRLHAQAGGALDTNLEAWVSPGFNLRRSGPVLLAAAGVGRQWGGGLSGFSEWGLGAGWRAGAVLPFAEYRVRNGWHAGDAADRQLVVGVHWIFWE